LNRSIHPEHFDVFSASETEDYYLDEEENFTLKFKRKKTNIRSASFRKFWLHMFDEFDFKELKNYSRTY
jgi:hypothetical protein